MKSIEFRGKSLFNNEWMYGNLHIEDATIIVHRGYRQDDYYPVDIKSIGQFTGLCDKDGKKIYEGDIVEATSIRPQDDGKKIICSIEWDKIHACYIFTAKDRRRVICNTIDHCILKTIGNIYDNPELLK